MKLSIQSSFTRWGIALLAAVVLVTALGRWSTTASASIAWSQPAHTVMAALTALLMILVVRKAWREQHNDLLLLPLATLCGVLYAGQAVVGAVEIARGYPTHLLVLHAFSGAAVWIALIGLVGASALFARDGKAAGFETSGSAQNSQWQRFKDFLALSKPWIVALLLLTTYAGLVAGGKAWPSVSLTFWTLLGGALAAGGSSALNQFIDRNLDKNMQRTAKRPLADGRLTAAEGLAFGLSLCFASYYVMAAFVNLLAALLSLVGIIYYVILYSVLLKKVTVQNIVIGGGAGAIPPMVGWAAASGHLGPAAWILFAIIFMWTPPHFWALAIVRMKDYERAGVPMLPVVRGEVEARRQIFIYTLALVAVTLFLPLFNLAGSIYLYCSITLGALLIYAAWRLRREGGNKAAWTMYRWSSYYLAFIFLALMIDAVR